MTEKWHNCYDEGWQNVIVPEAFSHPAKMSYGLLKRILAHAKEQGWLKKGDVVIDPFFGIGSTGILGAYENIQVIGIELEKKFCLLAEQNFKLHDKAWQKFGNPRPVVIQGDSRQLCQIVEKADLILSSPPFLETGVGGTDNVVNKNMQCVRNRPKSHIGKGKTRNLTYGKTPGQLGAMKPGKIDMVVSSPPFQQSDSRGGTKMPDRYFNKVGGIRTSDDFQGQTSGNLGNLKSGDVDCVISSPPYEKAVSGGGAGIDFSKGARDGDIRHHSLKSGQGKVPFEYSKAANNLGNQQGDTFWSAAKIIVEQCHQILKPGGHAIWVVKSFVRKGKIVDFPGDWQRLCESVGFKTVCIHHAMLVKETEHKTLFGHTEVKRKERKSFFRRLAESKGSPRIDFEVVLCMETPEVK